MFYENIIVELIRKDKYAMDHIGYILEETSNPHFAIENWLICFLDRSIDSEVKTTSLIDFLVGSAEIDYDYIASQLNFDK